MSKVTDSGQGQLCLVKDIGPHILLQLQPEREKGPNHSVKFCDWVISGGHSIEEGANIAISLNGVPNIRVDNIRVSGGRGDGKRCPLIEGTV